MSEYRVAINLELTTACNARCVMCPRAAVPAPRHMSAATFEAALARITPRDAFRVVLAGYGEPSVHPDFDAFLARLRGHPVPFDLVSNGERLTEQRLRRLDGVLHGLIVSFASVVPQADARVHGGLDHERVRRNLAAAARGLRHTALLVSLSPHADALETLPETMAWLRGLGIRELRSRPPTTTAPGTSGTRARPPRACAS